MLSVRVQISKTQATFPITLDSTRGITTNDLLATHYIGGTVIAPSVVISGAYSRPVKMNVVDAAVRGSIQLGSVPKQLSDSHDYAEKRYQLTHDMSHMITREAVVIHTTHRTTTNVIGRRAHLFAAAATVVLAIAMPMDVHTRNVAIRSMDEALVNAAIMLVRQLRHTFTYRRDMLRRERESAAGIVTNWWP